MTDNTLYLEHLHIEKMWGKYQVDWELDPKVNILVGGNGSGKTTILNVINEVCDHIMMPIELYWGEYKVAVEKITAIFNNQDTRIFDYKEKKYTPINERLLKTVKISTFDIETSLLTQLNTLVYGDGEENTDCFLKFQNRKLMLQNELLKSKKFEEASLADKQIEDFYQIVNEFFEDTSKRIVFNEQKCYFEQNGDKITLTQLSAGEKQLLIILLTILLQNGQPCLILMDEPEISLDTEWQAILIEKILALNPLAQLIIVTHSPSIFGDGWGDKLVWMEDIIQQNIENHG